MQINIEELSVGDTLRFGAALRGCCDGASSLEDGATRVARLLHGALCDRYGKGAVVLSRVYKTHAAGDLPADLTARATEPLGKPPKRRTPCLVLLGTAGDRPEWNDRRRSRGHQVIPLPSEEAIARLPMIATLIRQLGVPTGAILDSEPDLLLDLRERVFNVFHVEDAAASPSIPAKDFVADHGVRSAFGFGGLLLGSDLFAAIVFTRCPISRETAELFKTLALNVKLALLPLASGPLFTEASDGEATVMS